MEIAKEVIQAGLKAGLIRLETDPNMGSGTVCAIGDNWFYFGGTTAEEMDPSEYVKNVPEEDIVFSIYDVLEDFGKHEDFRDEYLYYAYFLQERLDMFDKHKHLMRYFDAVDVVCNSCHYCKEEICDTCPVGKTVEEKEAQA